MPENKPRVSDQQNISRMRIMEWLNYHCYFVIDTVYYLFAWADITY